MGGSVSRGYDNQDLIDKLKEAKLVRTVPVERVLRLVDRGNYFLPNYRTQAYVDSAWREGKLHLSAPCIYCEVLEQLDLKRGNSFLNIGSGTGYLNTLVGLLIGAQGINHGIECYEDNVKYAEQCLHEFLSSSDAVFEREFCPPQFSCANVFRLADDGEGQGNRMYDRIYCGAKVDEIEPLEMMKSMLSLNGVMVVPVNDKLKKITRVSSEEYTSADVMTVAFASLLEPGSSDPFNALLPQPEIVSLQTLCVCLVQNIFRSKIQHNKGKLPDLKRVRYTTLRSANERDNQSEDQSGRSSPSQAAPVSTTLEEKLEPESLLPKAMDVEEADGRTTSSGLRQDSESSGLGTSVDTAGYADKETMENGFRVDDNSEDSGNDEEMLSTMLPLRLLQQVYHRQAPQQHNPLVDGDFTTDESRDHARDLEAARAFRARLLHISRSNSPFNDSDSDDPGTVVPNVVCEQEYLFRDEIAGLAARLPLPPTLRGMISEPLVT